MTQTSDSAAIVRRFFLALDTLKDTKVIHGLTNFTEEHGINRRNLYQLRKNPERCILQVSWLAYLVNDYGVNAHWLLTGRGNIFGK